MRLRDLLGQKRLELLPLQAHNLDLLPRDLLDGVLDVVGGVVAGPAEVEEIRAGLLVRRQEGCGAVFSDVFDADL